MIEAASKLVLEGKLRPHLRELEREAQGLNLTKLENPHRVILSDVPLMPPGKY